MVVQRVLSVHLIGAILNNIKMVYIYTQQVSPSAMCHNLVTLTYRLSFGLTKSRALGVTQRKNTMPKVVAIIGIDGMQHDVAYS